MTTVSVAILFIIAIACSFQTDTSLAFTASSCQKPGAANTLVGSKRQQDNKHHHHRRLPQGSFHVLNASSGPDMPIEEELEGNGASMPSSASGQEQAQTPPAYVPPPPTRNSPPAVQREQRMDPLMASLTRDNSDQPTRNVPFFGEIPADGSLLLGGAVVFAVLGFIYSIVIAVNSSDQIVNSLSQIPHSISQTAIDRSNQVYDENVCRGLCSSQSDDIDGLRNFMESITSR